MLSLDHCLEVLKRGVLPAMVVIGFAGGIVSMQACGDETGPGETDTDTGSDTTPGVGECVTLGGSCFGGETCCDGRCGLTGLCEAAPSCASDADCALVGAGYTCNQFLSPPTCVPPPDDDDDATSTDDDDATSTDDDDDDACAAFCATDGDCLCTGYTCDIAQLKCVPPDATTGDDDDATATGDDDDDTTCTPNCTNKNCGDDGCGGSCGTCTGFQTCGALGICENPPACQTDTDCTDTTKPKCDFFNSGACVQCISNEDCAATLTTPFCSSNICVADPCGGQCQAPQACDVNNPPSCITEVPEECVTVACNGFVCTDQTSVDAGYTACVNGLCCDPDGTGGGGGGTGECTTCTPPLIPGLFPDPCETAYPGSGLACSGLPAPFSLFFPGQCRKPCSSSADCNGGSCETDPLGDGVTTYCACGSAGGFPFPTP